MLVFIDWYLPGYKAGGPIQSVANIISQLKSDFDFKVITSDTDLHQNQPYQQIKSDAWNHYNNTDVFYFSATGQTYKQLKTLMLQEQFDVVYINSLFSKYFAIYPLLLSRFNFKKTKVVIAPRGMLGKGALQLKSTKKNLFLALAKATGLFKNVIWHASTPLESDEIKSVFGNRANVHVALNLTKARAIVPVKRGKTPGVLKLVFLSRIAPKKNLLAIHQYLTAITPKCKIDFDYYGPIDDAAYAHECEMAFKTLPPHIKVNYLGVLAPDDITKVLSNYHLSILPTLNENFGHSIVESWVAGCPVLISNQTPWQNLESNNTGMVVDLNNNTGFIKALQKLTDMTQPEFDLWSTASYNFARKIINNSMAIEQNKKLFSQ